MSRFVGFKDNTSSFDPDQYRQFICANHGQEITAEYILAGFDLLSAELDKGGDKDWVSAMKDTPAYIKGTPN